MGCEVNFLLSKFSHISSLPLPPPMASQISLDTSAESCKVSVTKSPLLLKMFFNYKGAVTKPSWLLQKLPEAKL